MRTWPWVKSRSGKQWNRPRTKIYKVTLLQYSIEYLKRTLQYYWIILNKYVLVLVLANHCMDISQQSPVLKEIVLKVFIWKICFSFCHLTEWSDAYHVKILLIFRIVSVSSESVFYIWPQLRICIYAWNVVKSAISI